MNREPVISKVSSLLLLGMLVFPAAVAVADSDGYYCASRGYLAYETRFSGASSQHLLHIVRFSQTEGIASLPPIPLEDFQVHDMRCHPTSVEIAGGTTRYVIDISDPGQPVVTGHGAALDSLRAPQTNLGHWARASVIDLEADTPAGEFQLVISHVSRNIRGGIEHYTLTQLIRRDVVPGGPILASLKLFEGIFLETIDQESVSEWTDRDPGNW